MRTTTTTILGTILLAVSPAIAIERTSEIVFDTFERIDARLGELEDESAALDSSTQEAREQASLSISRIRDANGRRDEVAAEEERAELQHALARQLAAQLRKVERTREVYRQNRDDLQGIIPHLRKGGFGQTGDGAPNLEALISTAGRFGADAKAMLLDFNRVRDNGLRSKIAAATGSLEALSQSLDLLRNRQERMQAGDSHRIVQTVASYVDALDSALAQLTAARALLQDQQLKLQVANKLSTLKLIWLRVNGTPLVPNKANVLIEGILEDVERMDRETESYLYPDMEEGWSEDVDPGAELSGVQF